METRLKVKGKVGLKTIPVKPPNLRRDIKAKLEENEKNNFDVAVMMSNIYHSEVWKVWKSPLTGNRYDKFEDYCGDELNKSYRVGMLYVSNGDAIKKTGLTKEELSEIGFSVLKEMSGLLINMSKEDALLFIDEVKGKTHREAKDIVKSKKIKREIVGEIVKRSYTFNDEQAKLMDEAHVTCGELTELKNPNLQLEYMVTEWLMNHSDEYNEKVMESLRGSDTVDKKAPHKEHANKGK